MYQELKSKVDPSLPWLAVGDFNAILNSSESSTSGTLGETASQFSTWITDMKLIDHRVLGPWYTWSNKQEENPIARRLDRALVSESWLETYPRSSVRILLPGLSDHCGVLVSLDSGIKTLPRPFKYFSFWKLHPDYERLVTEGWVCPTTGSAMAKLYQKLRNIKGRLQKLNREHCSDIHERVKMAWQELTRAQLEVLERPASSAFQAEKRCMVQLQELQQAEASYNQQKSRQSWVNSGDSNSAFFHSMVKTRQAKNTIRQLISDSGAVLEDIEEIGQEAVQFYKGLLGTRNGELKRVTVSTLRQLLVNHLVEGESAGLCDMVTADEVYRVVKNMKKGKAPGPDGFTAEFFKEHWGLVGEEVTMATQEFFVTGRMRKEVNCTILALIPKVPNANTMKNFRPISCCNLVYKCISKIIANRLKKVLPKIISPNQSAFIKGRLITDNIIMANELVKWYRRKNISPRCALKIDIMKAFDSVDWDYLYCVLLAMGIPDKFVNWIKGCLESTSFTVCVNGGLTGHFTAKKGLRQGCPLSPYLFAASMEVLSCMFNRAASRSVLPYHPQCSRIGLTHLCFADDLLVFTKGTVEGVTVIADILQKFYLVSGLQCNPNKSEIFSAGVTEELQNALVQHSGFKEGALPVRYLGLPLNAGKLTVADCQNLVNRIAGRIQGWQPKLLSYAGKIELVISVLASMTQYWMQVILLPKKIIKEIESLCSQFLWGELERKKRAKVAWKTVALPRVEGGMGFKDLHSWNKACLVRHFWGILAMQETLWIAWLHAYRLRHQSIWEIQTRGSWIWNKILKIRDLVAGRLYLTDRGIEWDGELMQHFKISRVWHSLRPRGNLVQWSELVWKGGIPKNSVLTWLVLLNPE
ncbi:unnamed protein product [Linum trigynum]|uniref:Reverse transcriptase domain-containing protein n=1 Tax=Linum trigynum TaxID=586398 RepID=A0AAV2DEV3_9ROSI